MSKQDIQKKPTAAREPMVDVNASSPPLEIVGGKKNGLIRWLLLVGVLGLGGVAFWAATMWNPRPAGKTSQAEEQRLFDRFVRLRKEKDRTALDLLGPAPVFDEEPVSEQTAEARQTDFFLRANLQFVEALPGEPDGNGKQRAAKGRYTILTKGPVSSPHLVVRDDKGVAKRGQLLMLDPDLVVEVRNGKICGVRSELHMGP